MCNFRNLIVVGLLATVALATPPEFNASDSGTIFLGAINDHDWGRPLASGDLDGDGYDEIIVAASESYGDLTSRVYVVRGGPGRHGRGTVDLSAGGVDLEIVGAALNDNLGSSIATGDVNGDGIDDLLLCASAADYGGRPGAGRAYLLFGGADFFAFPVRDMSVVQDWDVRIGGPVSYGDMGGSGAFGGADTHAAAIGNLNGDIYGDIALGVHLANGGATQAGRVYVVHGGPFFSGMTINLVVSSSYDTVIYGDDEYDETGDFVLTADLTGDGIDELIIPNHYFSQYLFDSEGAVHIYRGRESWPTSFSLASQPADITLLGVNEYDELGESAAVGDFNGDGIADLAAAAPGADADQVTNQTGEGFVYGLLGSSAYQTGTHLIDYASATPDFLLVGEYQEGLGATTAAADFNGDGIDDIAAAERFAGPATNGVVEVLWGRDFAPGAEFVANVDTDLRIIGNASDRIGFSLSAANVNSDGLDEIVFGTPFNNGGNGTAYVFTHVTGDADFDRDVDLVDFARMQQCLDPANGEPLSDVCVHFDFDLDEVVGMSDLAPFTSRIDEPMP